MSPVRDLSAKLGPVRDQGPRGTCLAFAATAVHEQARRRRRGAWTEVLGEELLYWTCKQADGNWFAGTSPQSVGDALASPGQSAAALWPYDPNRDETDGAYSPPAGAQAPEAMRMATLRPVAHDLNTLRSHLDDAKAVILGLELWPGFYTAPNGALDSPSGLDLLGDGHAVALAGYDDDASELLLRNSWSATWGRDGHGRLPYDAVSTVARGAWTIDDDLDP